MAIYHCSVKTGSRGKGQNAISASAYRSGTKIKDYETDTISDYTRKGGVVYSKYYYVKMLHLNIRKGRFYGTQYIK